MKIVIVEDELVALDHLEAMIKDIMPEVSVLARITNVSDSIQWFSAHTADLVFMDINLSDGLSFKIFEKVTINCPVVFTTAYDQYALKAFEVSSIDYLLKPIKSSDLQRALNKYQQLKSDSNNSFTFDTLLTALKNPKKEYQKRFLVQVGTKLRKIETSDISYFYIVDKFVSICTKDNHRYPTDLSLDSLDQLLDPQFFFRINRQYIVHIDAIQNMHTMSNRSIKIDLMPQPEEGFITVSIQRLTEFKNWLNK